MKDSSDSLGPAQVDLYNEWEVIQHIRDLLNLSDFLERGLDVELADFVKKLEIIGWGKSKIKEFLEGAAARTVYEQLIPRALPEVGDRLEFEKNKSHWRK